MTSKELWWAQARKDLGLLPDMPRVFVAFMLAVRRRDALHAKPPEAKPATDVAEATRPDERNGS